VLDRPTGLFDRNEKRRRDVMLSRKLFRPLSALLPIFALAWGWCPQVLGANCSSSISAPCTIASHGSYTLTGNVVESTANVDAIPVTANDVTVNLNGWKLTGGPAGGSGFGGDGMDACTNYPSSCVNNTTVTNGHAFDSGSYGLYLGLDVSDLEDVQVTGNGDAGMFPTAQAIIYHDVAVNNAGDGITSFGYSVTERNASSGNTNGAGIYTPAGGGVVCENATDSNSAYGLNLGTGTGYARDVTGGNPSGGCNGGTSMGENLCN
jgi:hypothetical protein